MPSPLALIASSWAFYRKQPALNAVLLWLMILPATLQYALPFLQWEQGVLHQNGLDRAALILASFLLALLSLWGVASILLVGKRMIFSKAGRSRTSFRAVRSQSAPLILPLLFTSILRGAMTLYWSLLFFLPAILVMVSSPTCNAIIPASISLLISGSPESIRQALLTLATDCRIVFWLLPLIIPSLIYATQTIFAFIVVGTEKPRYRQALRRSKAVIHGHFWASLWMIVQLTVLLLLPSALIATIVSTFIVSLSASLIPMSVLLAHTVNSIATLLFTLCMIQLYGVLRDTHDGRPMEVMPNDE